jgi:hypothetical protein
VRGENPDGPKPPFRWGRTLKSSAALGSGAAGTAAATAAYTSGDPITVAVAAAIGFVGATTTNFAGEYMKHRADDPSPVFDGPTTLLFDTAGYIICLLLFVVPALGLDHALRPGASLPGLFGFAALFLSAFLMPVLRGLLINLGVARNADDRTSERIS